MLDDAIALHRRGLLSEAASLYRKLLAENPDNADALHLLGVAELQAKNAQAALALIDRAIVLNPNAVYYSNRGAALQELKCFQDALASYDRALSDKPDYVEALYGRGLALEALNRLGDAIDSYARALAIEPDHPMLLGASLQVRTRACNWRDLDADVSKLGEKIDAGVPVATPFLALTVPLSAARQKACAEAYVRRNHPPTALLPPLGRHKHKKIRLGYFSADFRNHATAYLSAGLFEHHDKTRFELTAFSLGSPKKDAMRSRLERSFDRFLDVGSSSDREIALLARSLEIDIAVDLKGFTQGSRTGIFALRAAPVQVAYLGYPGTTGAPYVDYLVADPTLIPEGDELHYTEHIAYMPDSYQVNDSTRVVSDRVFTRAGLGLPEVGFVFCCFNKPYKILPQVFDVWMRLLSRVPGSVLWLFAGDPFSTKHLKMEARARGIEPSRLVFAPRMAHAEHLARHGLADLFLDTLPCNAHTTASDALWAGLPMLTCMGETFAGRVGASVLKAVGLRELIAQDLAQYEALAFDLALEPKRLQSIKQKLASNRDTSPLFDTARLTRNIESAYEAMWERHQRGLAPEHVRVAVDDKPSVIDEAIALHRKGRLAEAVALYQRAIGWNPRNADALHLLGVAKFQSNDPIRGLSLIDQAISIDPANATYFCNRGAILQAVKRSEEALESCDRALALRPDYADALYNRGLALHDLRRFSDAVTSHDRALAVQPNHAGALAGSGHALQELERFPEALASYEDALAIDKNLADVARCHGDVLRRLNRLEEAITSYERSLAVKPDMPFLPGLMAMCKLRICDWRGLDDAIARLVRNIEAGQAASSPFPALALPLSSADQRSCAERYVRRNHPKSAALPPLGSYRHDRIRIGYFSADFRSHAVAYLMAEVFERHDRSAFEVMAFFFTAATKDSMRDRLEASFDRMADVSSLSDKDIALLARRHEIDIAVDLMGFTRYSRTGIFAFRAAPVQVNYLGFPGTMGAEYIDYLIADETVIPEGQDTHYAEKIAYLPHTYQPNDSTRKIGPKPFTRTECKLPDAGVVFCCFNKTYKIQPAMFDVWMRLLHRVSGSVLWLFSTDPIAMRNLKAAAHARGIDPARLVFAERLPLSDHLARHRVADLFLDTLPYNAHTTASDALWAGLPMITCLGETFAGRVGASVLRALGLPELVTHNVAEYEALAYEIATHPQQLASIRRTLDVNRAIHPLFDTPRFTKYLESAYRAMWQRHQQGLAPAHVRVHPGT